MDDGDSTEGPGDEIELEDSHLEDVDQEEEDADWEEWEEEFDAPARRRWVPIAVLVVLIAIGGTAVGILVSRGGTAAPAPSGPEGVALQNVRNLAPASTTASGGAIDGITCRTATDQTLKEHFHQHLDIFVNGQQYRIPAGVGIPAPQFP